MSWRASSSALRSWRILELRRIAHGAKAPIQSGAIIASTEPVRAARHKAERRKGKANPLSPPLVTVMNNVRFFVAIFVAGLSIQAMPALAQESEAERRPPGIVTFDVAGHLSGEADNSDLHLGLIQRLAQDRALAELSLDSNTEPSGAKEITFKLDYRFMGMDAFMTWYSSDETRQLFDDLREQSTFDHIYRLIFVGGRPSGTVTFDVAGHLSGEAVNSDLHLGLIQRLAQDRALAQLSLDKEITLALKYRFTGMDAFMTWYSSDETRQLFDDLREQSTFDIHLSVQLARTTPARGRGRR